MQSWPAGLRLPCSLRLGACISPANVEPGDGPAATATEDPTAELPVDEGTKSGRARPEEETREKENSIASFKDRYTYKDGIEVEITRIKHGQVTRADAEYALVKAGSAYVTLTVRVNNKSKKKLDVFSSYTLTYGADGHEAETPYLPSVNNHSESMSGKILPGRSKVSSRTFAISTKHQGGSEPPVLEFGFDLENIRPRSSPVHCDKKRVRGNRRSLIVGGLRLPVAETTTAPEAAPAPSVPAAASPTPTEEESVDARKAEDLIDLVTDGGLAGYFCEDLTDRPSEVRLESGLLEQRRVLLYRNASDSG